MKRVRACEPRRYHVLINASNTLNTSFRSRYKMHNRFLGIRISLSAIFSPLISYMIQKKDFKDFI